MEDQQGGIMIRVTRAIACVAGAVLCLAQPAFSSDAEVDRQLSEMRELVKGLQDKVEAQEEQLNHQGELLDDAQSVIREEEGGFRSNLASFFEKVEVDSWVAASYFYNFNKPSGRRPGGTAAATIDPRYSGGANGNLGASGRYYVYHPDHNQFMLDEVWFGIGKPATEDSRAGARFDILFGQTAETMNSLQRGPSAFGPSLERTPPGDVPTDLYVHQAYVEYLAPVGDGLNVQVGKFATVVGAEVIQSNQNFNITTGQVFNFFQPIDHVGLLATQNIGPASVSVGVANGFYQDNTPDINKSKVLLANAAYGMDLFSVDVGFLYGGVPCAAPGTPGAGCNNQNLGLIDLVLTADPIDALSLWLNFDYAWLQGTATAGWGLAMAGRYAVTDALGVAARGEYGRDNGGFFANVGPDSEFATLTGTIDYTIVEGLMVRGEVRWDWVAATSTSDIPFQFLQGNASFRNTQTTIGADVIYTF
jgi:hypothetical protein